MVVVKPAHLSCSTHCLLRYDVEAYQLAGFLSELYVAVAVHFYLRREPTRPLGSLLGWVLSCVEARAAGSSLVILATVARKFIRAGQLMGMILVMHFGSRITIVFVHLNSLVRLLRELK